MKHLLTTFTFVLLLAGNAVAQNASIADSAAQAATENWLALVDEGDYQQSWEDAAPQFQEAVSAEQWAQAAGQARGPIGALRGRTLINAQTLRELPNMPPANYMVIEYNSQFVQLPRAVETHVLMQGNDDVWRTVGYFVRPAQ